nr:replication protein A 70 kDa DNA-binding subunit B-like [Coffea arabica]
MEDLLNSLTRNDFPPHKLLLKPYCPIMLLRNIDPPQGLCNGTRLICKSLSSNIIHAVITCGEFAGKEVFIHRICFRAENNSDSPVSFERIQFPVRPCFTMTINKAQGQTLDFVGIYLREPVFSHGQLYVAMSRAKNSSSIKILIKPSIFDDQEDSIAENIVYTEGSTVEAMIYKSDIEFFRNHFQLYKRYILCNARVEYTPSEYFTHPNQCTWYIDNSTVVQAVNEVESPQIPAVFTFSPYRRFYQHMDDNTDIDVLGIVAEVHPRIQRATTATREVVLIDKSMMPVILTLWGEHETDEGQALANIIDTMPLIVALRIKVSSYHTLNLSTKFGSSILLNPPIQQAADLKHWAIENEAEIKKLIAEKAYHNRVKLLSQPRDDELTTIQDFLAFPTKKAYWLRGTPKLLDKSQRLWYNACPQCHKSFRAKPIWKIVCTSCNKHVNIVTRCRLTVELADYSGVLTLDLYDNDPLQLLPFTLSQMQELENKHELNYQAIEEAINNTIITCFVKKMANTHASGSTEKYSAIILHKSLLAEIISQIPSTTGYSEPNPELPSTSIDENVVSTAPKDTNVTSSCLSTLKISESPTKKQRSDKYQKQD